MNGKRTCLLRVNGFDVEATFSNQSIEHIYKPLLQHVRELYNQKKARIIVFLVAPPAVGKSTLAQFLEQLSKEDGKEEIQSIGLDGFHYPQAYLERHYMMREGKEILMKDVKGCPETFDIDSLTEVLKQMQVNDVDWPIYDRQLHDVVYNQQHVSKNIVLIEGNWLLLNDEKWNALRLLCDYSIQIIAKEELLKQRLIKRKVKGGSTQEEATRFYEVSDRKNVIRVLQDSQDGDCKLVLRDDLEYEKYEEV